MTAVSDAVASAIARTLRLPKLPTTSTASPARAKPIGATMRAAPGRAAEAACWDGGLPGGGADEDRGRPPAGVERAAGLPLALRGEDEVERVREPEAQDAGEQQAERAVHAPAAGGDRADDDADEDEVGDRVGEVRDDGEAVLAGRRVEHRLDDDGGADRADRERRGDAVDPERAREPAHARAQQRG